MATNFCANQVIYSASDSDLLIKIDYYSEYLIEGNEITNDTVTYTKATEGSSPFKIELISVNNPNIESLVIPKGFQDTANSDEYIVSSVASDAFPEVNKLRYVKLEYDGKKKKNFVSQIADGAFNFSSAANLEAVYVNFDANYTYSGSSVKAKFDESSKGKVLQYVDISSETINVSESKYEDNTVTISFSFNNIIPGKYSGRDYKSYPGYGYKITRSYANSGGNDKIFDSNDEKVSKFSVSEGKVTFTDKSIEQTGEEQEYNYTITAYDPFEKSVESKEDILVKIPAKTVSNPTPQPATPNKPSTIRPSNPVITPPTDNSQDEDNDEDETPKPETEILEPNENIHEEAEKVTNQEIDNTENNYQTGDILTKKILIITSIVFIIASISLWIIFNKKRKN